MRHLIWNEGARFFADARFDRPFAVLPTVTASWELIFNQGGREFER
jgi:hypothetical protein